MARDYTSIEKYITANFTTSLAVSKIMKDVQPVEGSKDHKADICYIFRKMEAKGLCTKCKKNGDIIFIPTGVEIPVDFVKVDKRTRNEKKIVAKVKVPSSLLAINRGDIVIYIDSHGKETEVIVDDVVVNNKSEEIKFLVKVNGKFIWVKENQIKTMKG